MKGFEALVYKNSHKTGLGVHRPKFQLPFFEHTTLEHTLCLALRRPNFKNAYLISELENKSLQA